MNILDTRLRFYLKICAILILEIFLTTNIDLAFAFDNNYFRPSAIRRVKDPSKYLHDRNIYKEEKKKKELLDFKKKNLNSHLNMTADYLQKNLARSADAFRQDAFQSFQDLQDYIDQVVSEISASAQSFLGKTTQEYGDGKIVVSQYGKVLSIANETVSDSHGNLYQRSINFGYDNVKAEDGNMNEYHEMKRAVYKDADGTTYGENMYTDWTGEYDRAANLTYYHQIDKDEFGNEKNTIWKDGFYDNRGNLLGFTEEIKDEFGNKTVRSWDASKSKYNDKNKVLSYQETLVDEYGRKTITNWFGAKYSSIGDLDEYHKTVLDTATGQITKTDWVGKSDEVNSEHLLWYKETITDHEGRVSTTVWNVGDRGSKQDTSYYIGKNVTEFFKVTTNFDGTQEEEHWYNGVYVRDNVESYNSDKVKIDHTGAVIEKENISFKALHDIRNNLINYSKDGESFVVKTIINENLLDYIFESFYTAWGSLDIDEKAKYIESKGIALEKENWNEISEEQKTDIVENAADLYLNQILSRTDVVVSEGLWNELSLDQRKIFLKSKGINVPANFEELGVSEQILLVPVQYMGTYQQGDVVRIKTILTEKFHDTHYDESNLLRFNIQNTSKESWIVDENENLIKKISVTDETLIRDAEANDSYVKGKLFKYTDYTINKFTDPVSGDTVDSMSYVENNIHGYNFNQQTTGYSTATREYKGIYDNYTEIADVIEDIAFSNLDNFKKFLSAITASQYNQIFGYTDYEDYNEFIDGITQGYFDNILSKKDSISINLSSKEKMDALLDAMTCNNVSFLKDILLALKSTVSNQSSRSNILYNFDNKVTSYDEEGIDDDGQEYKTIMHSMLYSTQGQMTEYRMQTVTNGIRSDYHRFNITYDALDRTLGYTEEIYSQGVINVVRMQNMQYDFADRLEEFIKMNINAEGQLQSWEHQQNIKYDSEDNILEYDSRRIYQGAETLNIRWSATGYNEDGKILGSLETGVDALTGRSYEERTFGYEYAQDEHKYNRGAITYETTKSVFNQDGSIYEQGATLWEAVAAEGKYYFKGNVLGFKETESNSRTGNKETLVLNTYDSNGNKIGSDTSATEFDSNWIANLVTESLWKGWYNTDGLLSGYQEDTSKDGSIVSTVTYEGESLNQLVMAFNEGELAISSGYFLKDVNGDKVINNLDYDLMFASNYSDFLTSALSGDITLSELRTFINNTIIDDSIFAQSINVMLDEYSGDTQFDSLASDVQESILNKLFKDINADGKIDSSDKDILGTADYKEICEYFINVQDKISEDKIQIINKIIASFFEGQNSVSFTLDSSFDNYWTKTRREDLEYYTSIFSVIGSDNKLENISASSGLIKGYTQLFSSAEAPDMWIAEYKDNIYYGQDGLYISYETIKNSFEVNSDADFSSVAQDISFEELLNTSKSGTLDTWEAVYHEVIQKDEFGFTTKYKEYKSGVQDKRELVSDLDTTPLLTETDWEGEFINGQLFSYKKVQKQYGNATATYEYEYADIINVITDLIATDGYNSHFDFDLDGVVDEKDLDYAKDQAETFKIAWDITANINLTEVEQRESTVYNDLGQIVSAKTTKTDTASPGLKTSVRKANILYNSLGQEISFLESTNVNGTSHQTIIDRDNLPSVWAQLSSEQQIDLLNGKTISYQGQSVSLKKNINLFIDKFTYNLRTNVIYDGLGRAAAYTDITRDLGFDENNNKTLEELNVITRNDIKYDSNGRISEYKEIVNSLSSPDLIKIINMKDIDYTKEGQMNSWIKDINTKGSSTETVIEYSGLPSWFKDDARLTIDQLSLVMQGQELDVTEICADATDVEIETWLNAGVVSLQDGRYILKLESSEKEFSIDKTEQVSRVSTNYNDLSQENGYVEIKTDEIGIKTRSAQYDIEYNALGQVFSYNNINHRYSEGEVFQDIQNFYSFNEDVTEELWNELNEDYDTNQNIIEALRRGESIVKITSDSGVSYVASQDYDNESGLANEITYISLDRLSLTDLGEDVQAYFDNVNVEYTSSIQVDIFNNVLRTSFAKKISIDERSYVSVKDIIYNVFAQQSGITQTTRNVATPDLVSIAIKSNIAYDQAGREFSFVNTKINQGSVTRQVINPEEVLVNGILNNDIWNTLAPDIQAELLLGKEVVVDGKEIELAKQAKVFDLYHVSATTRVNSLYDNFGNLLYSKETTSDSSESGIDTTVERSGIRHDQFGRETEYLQTTVKQGAGLEERDYLLKSGITYNDLGMQNSFISISGNNAASAVENITVRERTIYNAFGMETGFAEVAMKQGSASDSISSMFIVPEGYSNEDWNVFWQQGGIFDRLSNDEKKIIFSGGSLDYENNTYQFNLYNGNEIAFPVNVAII